MYIAYQGFRWNLECFQQPVNKLRINTDYEDLHQEQQLSHLPEIIRLEKLIHTAYEDFSPAQQFVLAHEISHILINRADPLHNPACFDREYDSERQYGLRELQERLNLGECQANTMAAMLLMPMPLLQNTLRRHLHRSRLPIYGESVLLPSTKPAIHAMADELGVSFSALLIQLKKYNLVDHREITEYFQKMRESI